ncbi:MAG: adenylate/guanylate cyclase domain-containing protein, partial [Actinomycetota bacterium]
MSGLPTGAITYFFTDIEGSTGLWERHPESMRRALVRHDELVASEVEAHGGMVVRSRGEGDSFFAVFPAALDAALAAVSLQRALLSEPWPSETMLRVRIALHTGEADLRGGDYYGACVNRCARLRAVAHGGQTVISGATYELIREALPDGVRARFLGAHRLKDLLRPEQIHQLEHPDLPTQFPPLRSLELIQHNLPVQTTSYVGQERKTHEVQRLVRITPLLTLTGAGGCGKTRLSLQAAAELADAFAEGAWLVELAPVSDPRLVPQAVASALRVRETAELSLTASLVEFLRHKELLLVLDNCEHVVAAAASLADELLPSCPRPRILATSREALRIPGESTWEVPLLTAPDNPALVARAAAPLELLQK